MYGLKRSLVNATFEKFFWDRLGKFFANLVNASVVYRVSNSPGPSSFDEEESVFKTKLRTDRIDLMERMVAGF